MLVDQWGSTIVRESGNMPSGLKGLVKPFVPRPLLARWKRFRFDLEQKQARGRKLEDVFDEIYQKGMWTPEGETATVHSGPGSMPGVTGGYEKFVAGYIDADPRILTLVDIGCGDFQVSSRILRRVKRPVRYIGCDIAATVVAENMRRHARDGEIEFRQLNVAAGDVPRGDIVTIREVFQHLSNETIRTAIENLRRAGFKRAIITEAVPENPSAPNLDIVSGYRTRDGLNSGVFLDQAPYNLAVLERYQYRASAQEILRTLIVAL